MSGERGGLVSNLSIKGQFVPRTYGQSELSFGHSPGWEPVACHGPWVPHIALVFCEMWDTTGLNLDCPLPRKACGSPRLLSQPQLKTAKQGHFCVLCRYGFNVVPKLNIPLTPTHKANVAKVLALISLKRLDFKMVVGSYAPVPAQPKLPAVGHSVGHFDLHDAGTIPVPAPPVR